MKGGIYQDKKRPGSWIVRFPGGISRRFSDLNEGERFLNMLRYRYDDKEWKFDPEDFKQSRPNGFRNLSNKWLDYRTSEVKCKRNLIRHISRAQGFFGDRNVKEIEYGDVEDYAFSLKGISSKTKKNYMATLHSFWTWCLKRKAVMVTQIPTWPEIDAKMKWRNTIPPETQKAILDEIYRISYDINPKIWIGIKWLMTYIAIRPVELIHIKEGDFNFDLGVVNVKYNKEDKPKIVPMVDTDLEIVKSFPTALPGLYFFRHGKRKGVAKKARSRFGKDYLYTWWIRACKNLGIEGVDMYGGCRHSTAIAMRKRLTYEQIKKASMHHTNEAFDRYFRIPLEDVRQMYAGNDLVQSDSLGRTNKVIDFKK